MKSDPVRLPASNVVVMDRSTIQQDIQQEQADVCTLPVPEEELKAKIQAEEGANGGRWHYLANRLSFVIKIQLKDRALFMILIGMSFDMAGIVLLGCSTFAPK